MCFVSFALLCTAAYSDTDKAYVWLLEELVAMDQQERSAFLAFVTSSPRLPPGGLGQLPKGAIVVCCVLHVLLRPARSRRVLPENNLSRLHTRWCNGKLIFGAFAVESCGGSGGSSSKRPLQQQRGGASLAGGNTSGPSDRMRGGRHAANSAHVFSATAATIVQQSRATWYHAARGAQARR